jgi:hypothetical protein
MPKVPDPGRGFVRRLGFAAAAIFVLSAASIQRADALSPISPGAAPAAKSVSAGLITDVRGGHGGGGGHGGFHGGGGHGMHFGGGGGRFFHGGGFRGGHVFHGGGFRHGGFAFGPHRHFFHHRRFYGSYYGDYYYPYRRCHIVWTYYGPRRVCHFRHWHRWHHWHHHWRYHHRWHHRHYW